MSAPQQDVSCINDEEVLRRMWQETDDYGRKKEIRTHMYKLREARLSEFYNANESNMATTEKIATSTATQHQTTKKSSQMSTHHADSLADHSFTQMKAKEIRDSESPTKELSLVVSDKALGLSDRAWDRIESKVTTSEDGKTQTISKMATASGTENINDTKLNYAVNQGQQFTTYQDGDDRNFVRGSQSVVKQEAVSASDDGNFRTSSSTHSSSSKFVTKSVTQGDDEVIRTSRNQQQRQEKQTISDADIARALENATLVKTQISEEPSTTIPNAKTKVTKETFSLPDGTVVTKVRYETRGGDEKLSTEKRSSSSTVQSTKSGKVVSSSRTTGDDQVTVTLQEYPSETTTRSYRDETSKVSRSQIDKSDQKRFADNVVVSENIRRDTVVGYDEPDRAPKTDSTTTTVVKVTKTIDIEPICTVDSTRTQKDITSKVTEKVQDIKSSRVVDNKTSTILVTTQDEAAVNNTDRKIETTLEDTRFVDTKRPDDSHTDHYKTTITADINVEKPLPRAETKPCDRQQPREKSPTKPKEKYPPIDRQRPHKPDKSELDQKLEPTDGQYETTYRTDYTNKTPSWTDRKIYVEVNPTHEAFARSLRAVSPDRVNKSSTHSLPRNSPSPDKYVPSTRQPSRQSPERKPTTHDRRSTSPRKSPEKFSSSETITYGKQTRSNQQVCDIDSSTLTRRHKQSPSPPKIVHTRPEVKEIDSSTRRPRQPSPTKTVQNTTLIIDLEDRRNRVTEIDSSTLTRRTSKPKQSPTSPTKVTQVTDLDTNETVVVPRGSVTTTTVTTTNKIKKLQSRSPSSPLSDSANKSPKETVRKSSLRDISPVKDKRTKTYEERCKEILGINTTKSVTKRDSQKSIDLDSTTKSTRLTKRPSQDKLPDSRPATDRNLPSDEDSQRLDQFSDLNSSIEFISTVVDEKHTTTDFLDTERQDRTKVAKTISTEEYDTTQRFLDNESVPQEHQPGEKSPRRQYPDETEPKVCSRSTPEIDYLDQVLEKHTPIEITVRIPGLPYDTSLSKQKTSETTRIINTESKTSDTRTDVRTTKSPERESPEKIKPGTNQRPGSKPEPEPTKKTVITNGFTVDAKRRSPDKEAPKEKWDKLKTQTDVRTSESTEITKKTVREDRKSPERHSPTTKPRPSLDKSVDKPWRQTSPISGKSPEKTSPISRPRSSPEKNVEPRRRSPAEEYPKRKSPERVTSPTKSRPSPGSETHEKPLRQPAVTRTYPERAEPTKRQRSPVDEVPKRKSPEKASLPSKPRPSPETDRADRKPVEEIPRRKSPERTSPIRSGPRTTSEKDSVEKTVTTRTTVTEKLPDKPAQKYPDETIETQEIDQIIDKSITRKDEVRRVSNEISINLTTDQKPTPGKPSVKPRESPERRSPEKIREKATTDDNVCPILSPDRQKPTKDTIVRTEEVIVIADSSSETEEQVRRTTQKIRTEEASRIYPQPRQSPEKKPLRPTEQIVDVRRTTKTSVTKPESSESETDEDEVHQSPSQLREIKIEKTETTVDTGLLRKHPVPVPDETISITEEESTRDTSRLQRTSLDTAKTSKVTDVVITSILKTSKDKKPTSKDDTPSVRKQPEGSKPLLDRSPVQTDETISITEEEIIRTTDEKTKPVDDETSPRKRQPAVQETVTVTTSTSQTTETGRRPTEDDAPLRKKGPDSRKPLDEKSPVRIDETISITEEKITTTSDKKRKIVDTDEVTDQVTTSTCRLTSDKRPTKDQVPLTRKGPEASRPVPGKTPVQIDEIISITEENLTTTSSKKRKSVDTDKLTDTVVTSCSRTTGDKKPTKDDKIPTKKSPDTSKPLPGKSPVRTHETTEESLRTTLDRTVESTGKITDAVTTSTFQTTTSDKRPTKDDTPSTKKGPVSGKPSPQTRQSPGRVITKTEEPSDSDEDLDSPRSPLQPKRPWEETTVRREHPRTTDFVVETDLPRKRPVKTEEMISITTEESVTDRDVCSRVQKTLVNTETMPKDREPLEKITTTTGLAITSILKTTKPSKDDATPTKKRPDTSDQPVPKTEQSSEIDTSTEKTSEKQGTYLQKYLEAAMKAKAPPQKDKPKVSRLLEDEPPKSRKPVAETVQPSPKPETRESPVRDIKKVTSTICTNTVDKTRDEAVSKTRITGKRTPAQPKPKSDSTRRSPDRTTKETRQTITEVSQTIHKKNKINETRNKPKEPNKPKQELQRSPDRTTTKRTQPITEISNTTYKTCRVNGVKDDEIVKKKITNVSATNNQENRVPVEEPPFIKKHIRPMGPEDEKIHKTVKKDLSRSEPYRRPQAKKPVLIDEIIVTKPKTVQTVSRTKPETQRPGAVVDNARKSSIKTETRTTLTSTVVSTPTTRKPSSTIEKKPVSTAPVTARVPDKPSTKVKIVPTKITRLPTEKPTKPVRDDETSSNASSTEQFIEETRRDWTTTEDDVRTNKKIVVNLRRSKSSKESSPDRICPLPVSSIDIENAPPRYPDEIQEPEDDDSKPRKIFAIQEDHVTEHAKIREIDDEHEDDKHSLSVSQKINKFITEAEQLTAPKKLLEITKGSRSAPKTTDGSVLEKISLFTTKAGNVDDEFIKREQEREINSRACVDKKDSTKTINLTMIDVKATETQPDRNSPEKLSRLSRPRVEEPEPGRSSPERHVRVSPPRVKEFEPGRTSPEKLYRVCPPSAREPEPGRISLQKYVRGSPPGAKDHGPGRTSPEKLYRVSSPDAREPERGRLSPDRFARVSPPGRASPERLTRTSASPRVKEPATLTSIELMKNISNQRTRLVESDQEIGQTTPRSDEVQKNKLFDSTSIRTDRRSSDEWQRTRESTHQRTKQTDHSESSKLYESTPKTGRRPSGERPQFEDVSVSESSKVKCAKALFETTPERRETYKPRNILDRPSVFESKRLIDEESRKSTTRPSTKESLRSSSIERTFETEDTETGFVRERSPGSTDDQLPGYMRPLDRSLRANSPHRESIGVFKKTTSEERDSAVPTRVVNAHNEEENVILGKSKITEDEIERIYDLEILEELLKVVIGYDLRKKLREQMRLVKRMTEEELQIRKSQIINEERIYSKNVTENRNVQVRRTSSERLDQSQRRTSLTKKTDSSVVQKTKTPQADKTSRVVQVVTRRKSPSPSRQIDDSTNVTTTSSCTRTGSYSNQVVSSTRSSKPNQEDKVRVQGTVIRSQYYSENDNEPQVTVTKYSYDSNDMDQPTKDRVIANVSLNGTNADEVNLSLGDVLTNEKDFVQAVEESLDNEVVTQRTSKRRGSVKALSKKFIENAVETSKSERQSSYPKAGLILRTSSFKESSTANKSRKGSETSRSKIVTSRASPARTTKNEINRTSSSSSSAHHHHVESSSTTQHRSSSSKTTTSSTTSSRVVSSSTNSGGIEPQSKALVVKRTPTAAAGHLEEKTTRTKTTKTVIEQHADYQEHSKFQTRVRKVMAEQEGCIETTEQTTENAQSQSSGSSGGGTTATSKSTSATSAVEGESQLLPLLQGLLLEAPDNTGEQTADSGTESGEDHQRSGLIAEVQGALNKLSANLLANEAGISQERRNSLLQLVGKLQAGLAQSAPSIEGRSEDGTSTGLLNRRRQRSSRHTVGVSTEELADARKLIEEISMKEFGQTSNDCSNNKSSQLQKQHSEGSVISGKSPGFKPAFMSQKSVVKNAIAKPFSSSSNSTVSGNSSSVQTPTDASDPSLDLLFNENTGKDQGAAEKPSTYRPRSVESQTSDYTATAGQHLNIKSVHEAVQQAAANKIYTSDMNLYETDEDSTVKAPTLTSQDEEDEDDEETLPENSFMMVSNPIYSQQRSHPEAEERGNRFLSKKLRMKRANTIDIPKPFKMSPYDNDGHDSDCSLPEEDYGNRRLSNYLALRGPIRIGNNTSATKMPTFEPKTENDKKFLAFISKHNENTSNKGSLWAKPVEKGTIWNHKFGNIKTNFERAAVPVPANQAQSAARQFWKSSETTAVKKKWDGSTNQPVRRNTARLFESKPQKEPHKLPWNDEHTQDNVVTGSLRLKTVEQEKPSHKFVPQPLPVNKFSHAPQSAFKPLARKPSASSSLPIDKTIVKSETHDLDSPLYLYSPKPQTSSPSKPWQATSNEHGRVLNLAASKFEKPAPTVEIPLTKLKPTKDKKIVVPQTFQLQSQPPPKEKVTAPYLAKTVQDGTNNTVRKLSGQYDSIGQKNDTYVVHATTKYVPAQNSYYSQRKSSQDRGQYVQNNHEYQDGSFVPSLPHKDMQPQYLPQNQRGEQYQSTVHTYNQLYQNQQAAVQYQQSYQNQPKVNEYQQPSNYQYHQQPYQQYQQTVQYQQPSVYQQSPSQHQSPMSPTSRASNLTNQQQQQQQQDVVKEKRRDAQQYLPIEPQKIEDPQYTSNFVYQPSKSSKSPQKSPTISVSQPPPKLDTQVSVESVHEYTAVSSKVMTGPVSQQAETIRQKSPMSRDEHEISAALGLKNTLQKINNGNNAEQNRKSASKSPQTAVLVPQPQQTQPLGSNVLPQIRPQSDQRQYADPKIARDVQPQRNMNTVGSNLDHNKIRQQPETRSQMDQRQYGEPNVARNVQFQRDLQPIGSNLDQRQYADPKLARNVQQEMRSVGSHVVYNNTTNQPRPYNNTSSAAAHVRNTTQNKSPTRSGLSSQSFSYNSSSRHQDGIVISPRLQIPVIQVPPQSPATSPGIPNKAQIMNKQDTWNQICLLQQPTQNKPSPRSSPNARTVLKSKSSHSLAVPKQFEAGMSKDEMAQKKRSLEAFFVGNKSPQSLSRNSSADSLDNKTQKSDGGSRTSGSGTKRAINRIKTSEKISAHHSTNRQVSSSSLASSGGLLSLSRSRTLPDIVCPPMLDESNVDKAFDDLFKSSS